MRVVEPYDRARIIRPRTGSFRNLPGVGVSAPGRNCVVSFVRARCSILVQGTLGTLVVEHAVWMHAEGVRSVVLEDHPDGVTDFRSQNGTENAGVFPFGSARLELGEGRIGVFAVESLAVDGADAMRPSFSKYFGVPLELHAHHFVDASGGIVPLDFVSGDVVGANFRRGIRLSCLSHTLNGKRYYRKHQHNGQTS